jgi:hypothetical protein
MNRKIFIKLSLLLIVTVLLSSCGTRKAFYRYVYPPASYSELRDGYWGEWKELTEYGDRYYYNIQTKYDAQTLEILIYYKERHPSDFKAKIIIDKRTGVQKDKTWTSYRGTITAAMPTRLDYKYINELLDASTFGEKHTINCEIRCDADMQKAIQKNGLFGVMNLFYGNGMGDALHFQ